MTLSDPFPNASDAGRLVLDTDPKLKADLFHMALGGTRGCRSAVINTLLNALYLELKSLSFDFTYDPDNDSRIADVLSRCNFKSHIVQPARPRRANTRPIVDKAQCAGQGHEPGPTHCTSD